MTKPTEQLEKARRYERLEESKAVDGERPLFHLTPRVGWMNDPNGFCFYSGKFHLFYQYHPYSRDWGPMHWGHAESADLLRWAYLPCALAPDTQADRGGCFSGSAVPLPDGRLMLAYTGVQEAPENGKAVQAQCVAFGDGTDFEKSPRNPVVSAADLPEGCDIYDFRDPKAWLTPDGRFQMAVANRHKERQGTILLFESNDGLSWRYRAALDSSGGIYGQMWECPDFFSLGGKQALLVSAQNMRAKEGFHPGHGSMAILGSYDEKQCRFVRETVQPLDEGLDFYAPQTVLAPDGRRILIAWMDNWQYCKRTPRPHPWYAQMTVPREIAIEDGRLIQRPVREIEALWRDTVRYNEVTVGQETVLPGVEGRLLDAALTVRPLSGPCRFTVTLARDQEHRVVIEWDSAREELLFDRSGEDTCQDIAHIRRVRVEKREEALSLRMLLDRESVELFLNGGRQVLTAVLNAPAAATGVTFASDAPALLSVEAHPLGASPSDD